MMEQLFSEIFCAAQRRRPAQHTSQQEEHSRGRLGYTSMAGSISMDSLVHVAHTDAILVPHEEHQIPLQQEEDACHCGEPAQRTCACGARVCHNHFYDGEGNLAGRDLAGFCAECVDLIREEAAGIARYGKTQ